MKKLFTLAIALVAFLGASAQDPSSWKAGDNVAAALGMGDVDGTSFSGTTSASTDDTRPHDLVITGLGDYWKCDGDLPNEFREPTDDCCGIIGFYDKQTADIYQIVKFPAGSYTIDVQALYREGTPADNFVNHFNKKFIKNGHLYAEVLASNDPSAAVTRSFDKVLCSLATADQHESLYYYGDGSWMNDYMHEVKDAESGEVTEYYCPQCLTGLGQYFAADKYHNTMKLVLTEDSYVRIGFRKTGYITADWLVFTNMKVIYEGVADEAAKVAQAKEEVSAALSNFSDIYNDVDAAGVNALAALVSDTQMGLDTEFSEATTIAELDALLIKINNLIDDFRSSLLVAKNLSDLISMSTDVIASTNFPGLNDFKTAFATADAAVKNDDVDALGDSPSAYYQKIYAELAKARADYLNSQPSDENGAKDFTSLVKNPWFVNPEYTPTHNDDGTWTLSEETWGWGNVGNPNSYASAKNGRTDISSDVVLAPSDDVTNQWYKKNAYTGWSSGIALYYQSGLIGASDGWNSLATGTIGIEQQLVGLPSGYYSLKALVRGNDGDVAWDGKSREIYAINSNGEVVVSETVKNDSQRPNSSQYGWYEWNPNAWADVETSIISALDGKLTIGGRCSKVANFTGFRLYFYGEDLDFSAKIQEYLDILAPQLDELMFEGDKKAINDILAQIKNPIADKDAYEVAFGYYNEAKNALDIALAGEKAYTAANKFSELFDEHDFVLPAFTYTSEYGSKETDTYEGVAELNATAAAYSDYCEVYDKAVALNDAVVNAVIEKQTTALKAEMVSKETIFKYLDNLALPYNVAVLAAAGAAEATEANPASATSLLINPSFAQGPKTGWNLEVADPSNNSYGRELAECWNQDPFTISQTLYGLPAGDYEIRVRACYRDGGSVTQEMIDNFKAANGDYEAWANHNVVLFANDNTSYVKATCDGAWTTRSFDKWYNVDKDGHGEFIAAGWTEQSYNDNLCILAEEYARAYELFGSDEDLWMYVHEVTPEDPTSENIFDTQVGDNFYPCSTAGFMYRIKNTPDAYCNSVKITLTEGEPLTIGLRKSAKIDSDWLIYDDFELLYLSGEKFKEVVTGVSEVKTATSNGVIYNVAGQRLNSLQKGINIVDGKKIYVK